MEIWHGTQHSQLLDGLVGRSILAYADTVVGQNVGQRRLHQGGQSCHRLHVITEYKEGSNIGKHAAMQRQAISDCRHSLLADAEVQVLSGAVLSGKIPFSL